MPWVENSYAAEQILTPQSADTLGIFNGEFVRRSVKTQSWSTRKSSVAPRRPFRLASSTGQVAQQTVTELLGTCSRAVAVPDMTARRRSAQTLQGNFRSVIDISNVAGMNRID
jgi:hypothetical protein